jgi:hypothetical protein
MTRHNVVPLDKMMPFSAAVLRQRVYALSVERMSATGWLLGWRAGDFRRRFHGATVD